MKPGIIFDLDGTLVDSAPDLHAVSNELLAENGLGAIDLASVTSFIGHGIPNLVSRIFTHAGRPLSGDNETRAVARFIEIYSAAPARLSRLYPGVEAALTMLTRSGYPLGICTNKAEDVARRVIADIGLGIYIKAIVGGGRTKEKKPHPAPLYTAAGEAGCERNNIIYVGDSETDAATASAAAVPFILFTRGYRSAPVEELPHNARFDDFSRLPGIITRIESAAL